MPLHRLLFFADSPATPWPADAGDYTAFSVRLRTRPWLNLCIAQASTVRLPPHAHTPPLDFIGCPDLGMHDRPRASARADRGAPRFQGTLRANRYARRQAA